jgi:arsenite-transporting ATPase
VPKNSKRFFFVGKGGTGKTTISVLTALALSRRNIKTALISLDPAHNLFDVLNIQTSKSKFEINKKLIVEEINIKYWLQKYLETIEKQVTQSYQYLTSLNLDKHFEVLKFSPGMEEYALIYAYKVLNAKYSKYDYLVFDMPPTALALRFFNLPGLSLVWLEKLIQIRSLILEKKNIISSVDSEQATRIQDKILDRLHQLKQEYEDLQKQFLMKRDTQIIVVLNNEDLSIRESQDIYQNLAARNINVSRFVLNKIEEENQEIHTAIKEFAPLNVLPLSAEPLIGIDLMDKFSNTTVFNNYLDILCNSEDEREVI